MTVTIRTETPEDLQDIWQVTKDAFADMPYAGGDEQDLVNVLRSIGALSLSLVATDGDELVGQVTFSPATISSSVGTWFALGPISVKPGRQSEGIGGQLIEAGIDAIQELDAWGCILTGNPDYYSRHGFSLAPERCPTKESSEYFMLRMINNQVPTGKFAFHDAFYANS